MTMIRNSLPISKIHGSNDRAYASHESLFRRKYVFYLDQGRQQGTDGDSVTARTMLYNEMGKPIEHLWRISPFLID